MSLDPPSEGKRIVDSRLLFQGADRFFHSRRGDILRATDTGLGSRRIGIHGVAIAGAHVVFVMAEERMRPGLWFDHASMVVDGHESNKGELVSKCVNVYYLSFILDSARMR